MWNSIRINSQLPTRIELVVFYGQILYGILVVQQVVEFNVEWWSQDDDDGYLLL